MTSVKPLSRAPASPQATPAEGSSPRPGLPILYFLFGHLCLTFALAVPLAEPRLVAGFFYHPRMLAVVHAVTLGWVSSSILGALYAIVPMALGGRLAIRAADGWAYAAFVVGTSGVLAHFWLDSLSGVVWSGALVALAFGRVAWRVLHAIAASRLPPEVALHFRLAFANLLLAVTLGLLVGIDKTRALLPGAHLSWVYAHAHLAALGWVTMTVMAAGYRLLPMILPAAMPRGRWVWASAIVLETGILALAGALAWGPRSAQLAAATLTVSGLALFLGRVAWMQRNRRPAPRELVRPDWAAWQLVSVLLFLLLAAILGLALVATPQASWKLPAVMAYGVFGLLGFLSQMVVAVLGRLGPLYATLRTLPAVPFGTPPPSPFALAWRPLQVAGLGLWALGVPTLATALAIDHLAAIRAGAGLLTLATILNLVQMVAVFRRARTSRTSRSETAG